jgi:serine/threonine protein kinase
MSQISFPASVQNALKELESHYQSFSENFGGANGYLFYAQNRVSLSWDAIKFYYIEPGDRSHAEPRALHSVDSENVLQVKHARRIDDEWAFFITPYCDGGNLDGVIAQKPSVHDAIAYAQGIVNGVSSLHKTGLIHRDLKPANIVLSDGVPKIADFGSVRQISCMSGTVNASGHSVLYKPPEAHDLNEYGVQGDIYQIGLVLFQLLGGDLPYQPEKYFKRRELKDLKGCYDNFERSKLIDSVLRKRVGEMKLADFNTLPPWISRSVRRSLRALINPERAQRVQDCAEVASILSQMRSTEGNWRYKGDCVELDRGAEVIQLRPDRNGNFVAYKNNGNGFRKVRGWTATDLSSAVKNV